MRKPGKPRKNESLVERLVISIGHLRKTTVGTAWDFTGAYSPCFFSLPQRLALGRQRSGTSRQKLQRNRKLQ